MKKLSSGKIQEIVEDVVNKKMGYSDVAIKNQVSANLVARVLRDHRNGGDKAKTKKKRDQKRYDKIAAVAAVARDMNDSK